MPVRKNLVCFVSVPSCVSRTLTCHCFMQCVRNEKKKKFNFYLYLGLTLFRAVCNANFANDFRKIIALSFKRAGLNNKFFLLASLFLCSSVDVHIAKNSDGTSFVGKRKHLIISVQFCCNISWICASLCS
jgi:hypothetical protein